MSVALRRDVLRRTLHSDQPALASWPEGNYYSGITERVICFWESSDAGWAASHAISRIMTAPIGVRGSVCAEYMQIMTSCPSVVGSSCKVYL